MKKRMLKRFAPLMMVGAVSLGTVAPAVTAVTSTSVLAADKVTITVPNGDNHEYEVYQIFTGDISNGSISNPVAGHNYNTAKGTSEADIKKAIEAISGIEATATDKEKLAVIEQYVNLTGPIATISKANPGTNLDSGYYLIKDKSGTLTGKDTYSLYIVQLAENITLTRKSDVPTLTKEVQEYDFVNGYTTWGEEADYAAGDTIKYKLTATLPTNFEDYSEYKLTFKDTLGQGLDFTDITTVKVGDEEITANIYNLTNDTSSFELAIPSATWKGQKPFVAGVTAGTVVTVEYTAKLNENAVTGYQPNTNSATIVYSNNPNTGGEGDTATSTPTDAEVYTYSLQVNKLNEQNQALQGAGFTLYKVGPNLQYEAVGAEKSGGSSFEWDKIDSGEYELRETTTPSGYNTIKPIKFTIKKEWHGQGIKLTIENIVDPDNALYHQGNILIGRNGELTAEVVNTPGLKLPSTGAMGLIAIIAGAGAVLTIGLVARRRNREEVED